MEPVFSSRETQAHGLHGGGAEDVLELRRIDAEAGELDAAEPVGDGAGEPLAGLVDAAGVGEVGDAIFGRDVASSERAGRRRMQRRWRRYR